MDSITIRDATASDTAAIADFNSQMALETEGRALAGDSVSAGVAAVLDDPSKGRYWVAVADNAIVGQIMVTFEWSDWRNGLFWWIQSVYVDQRHRRRGVFSALYRHVESLARRDPQVCGLRLYVERSNERAMQTYLRLGMTESNYRVMETEFGAEP